MSSLRIVLVDPLGEVLFSGESLARSPANAREVAVDSSEVPTERCPETLRSEGSGVYRAADRGSMPSPPVTVDEDDQIRAETVRARRLRRAG